MSFGHTQFLYALLILPFGALFVAWAVGRKRDALTRLGDPALLDRLSSSVSFAGRRWRTGLWFLALALVLFALARPQWGDREESVRREGVQLMVALDVSQSMLAEDIKPSRLERAKLELGHLMDRLDGDEIGLVLFSGASFVQLPLTSDYTTARKFLEGASPDVISRQGTVIGRAIDTALSAFPEQRLGQKVILLMTDGEDQETDPVAAAGRAADEGAIIYVLGFGVPEGTPIPLYGSRGELLGYKMDRNGQIVLSKLDEATLEQVAHTAGGRYLRVEPGRNGASEIAADLDALEQGEFESQIEIERVERFQIFLLVALLAMVAAELIPDRVRRPRAGGDTPGMQT